MRLTNKNATKQGTTIGMPKAVACYWKLKPLEDIEEELGIDLITLFKALTYGIYVKEINGKIKYYNPDQIAVNWVGNYPEIVFLNTAKKGGYCALNTKACKLPYTPTWALTKEELINEKEN